jgi:uncharacterized RDD family membrane protein YckC
MVRVPLDWLREAQNRGKELEEKLEDLQHRILPPRIRNLLSLILSIPAMILWGVIVVMGMIYALARLPAYIIIRPHQKFADWIESHFHPWSF